jgi:hypothetical protein
MAHGSSPSSCQHSGYYSGLGKYSRDSKSLRYVLVCDDCGREMMEVETVEYAPDPCEITL